MIQVMGRLEKQSRNERCTSPAERMMAITPETGRFYNILLRAMGASSVLEIGLSHGYSTIWFADGIQDVPGSRITTLERDSSKCSIAGANLREAGVDGMVNIRQGDAADTLDGLEGPFDFVFIDADKENAIGYFEACLPLVRRNGIIAADNTLDMREMRPYIEHVRRREGVRTVTLHVGWGQELTARL
ncbi:O-methyltransferase [Cenarchaeum symbiosum A]|uniref:O-methyltransferase n=1 Tax=Cenarchaeum symbiosum (strain A) TaxID=414004 RepID=A0RUR5_CENSY|nr:O-methyltransferase [Cenarchaeum symbiosum A]